MRRFPIVSAAVLAGTLLAPGIAASATSCLDGRAGCEAVCTPGRVWQFYAGSVRRCTASCEPRFQQCLRSGYWVDLERLSTGGYEPVGRF